MNWTDPITLERQIRLLDDTRFVELMNALLSETAAKNGIERLCIATNLNIKEPDERYVHDGLDALLDLNADGSVATSYLNGLGIDNHLRQTNSTTGTAYFLTDHLSSTAALTDTGGVLVEQLGYDSFGNNSGS